MKDLDAIYAAARARAPQERATFLDGACEGDQRLRARVEEMLAKSAEADAFFGEATEAVETPLADRASTEGKKEVSHRDVPAEIGHYAVGELIGAGGMGRVYLGRDNRLGRAVAIKILPATFVEDSALLERFRREARVLASLNHPNIATIHGLEEVGEVKALVLELVEGGTLEERITDTDMALEEALPLFGQIAEALEAAHLKAIVHRDLKPANIGLDQRGHVKVLDFGLAKRLAGDGQGPGGTSIGAGQTVSG